MESLGHQEENIIKDIRNLLDSKKNKITLELRKLSWLEKETTAIKDRILKDIKNRFEHEEAEENYYKPVRVSNF